MPTIPQLERRLARIDREIARLWAERELWARTIEDLRRLHLTATPRAPLTQDESRRLTRMRSQRTVGGNVTASEYALRESRRQGSKDAFVTALLASGWTVRGIAATVGVSHPALLMARRGKRRIKRTVAERIAELTGWTATAEHWPGGISD